MIKKYKTYKLSWESNPYFYFGSTVRSLRQRFIGHRSTINSVTRFKNPKLEGVWKKYGDPKIILIAEYETKEEMVKAEQDLLDRYIGIPECLNINPFADRPHQKRTWRASRELIERTRLKQIQNGRCKLNSPTKRAVIAEKNGIKLRFESVREAARQIGKDHKGIIRSIKGEQPTCGSYTWKYEDGAVTRAKHGLINW